MRILHYYPASEPLISDYVKVLADNAIAGFEHHTATEPRQARTLLEGGSYDVLHLHGCWRNSLRVMAAIARRQGTRVVVTPHGQLQPWVRGCRRWTEKIPKQLLYQRDIISRAYAVVIQGAMEQECMRKLGWNRRCVIIRNCLITDSITPLQMARRMAALYQQVMDSNPWQLMDDDSRRSLAHMLKAGITGDSRWLQGDDRSCELGIQWRPLMIYAHLELLKPTVERGISVLGLQAPDVDTERIATFLPDGFSEPQSIERAIGMDYASENDRLLATFRHLRKLIRARRLSMSHLVELDRELRQHDCDEQLLEETLQERHLLKPARRLMQLMSIYTGLTEGYMPVAPLADRSTRSLQRQIENRLNI